jgi:hypothetical protein
MMKAVAGEPPVGDVQHPPSTSLEISVSAMMVYDQSMMLGASADPSHRAFTWRCADG